MADNTKNPFQGMPGMDWAKDLPGFWSQALPKGLPSGNAEMLDRVRAVSKETAAFVEERLRKDVEAAKALTEAKSPTDVARINMEYLQTLMTDYNRQSMKMAEEATKTIQSMFSKWPGMPGK